MRPPHCTNSKYPVFTFDGHWRKLDTCSMNAGSDFKILRHAPNNEECDFVSKKILASASLQFAPSASAVNASCASQTQEA